MARPNILKRGLVLGAVALIPLSLIGCVVGLGVMNTEGSGDGSILVPLGFLGCLLVGVVSILGVQLWLVVSGGPVLAVGPAGLWIKSRPTRGQAVWLPWEGIAQISRRRWSLEKMVVVQPRDPRADAHLGAFTALDAGMLKLFYGSGFTATLNFADKPEQEIMAAITHFSAGRCRITW